MSDKLIENEKELTIDEIKNAVSMVNVLNSLYLEIDAIKNLAIKLSSDFNEMKKKFNENTIAVESYQTDVRKMLELQPKIGELQEKIKKLEDDNKELNAKLLAEKIVGLNIPTASVSETKETKKQEKPKAETKTSEKTKTTQETDRKEKEKIEEIADELLRSTRGQKSRILRVDNITKGFKVGQEMATKVLDYLTKIKVYNPKSFTLTFPKNNK